MKQGKTWGHTIRLFSNDNFEVHRICINQGYKCSTHYHRYKHNIFYVESGEITVHVEKSDYKLVDITTLKTGEMTDISPGEKHHFEGIQDSIVYEIYYSEPIGNDIIRSNVGGKLFVSK